ncbi:MAG TPA: MmgE/PrpD family protein [Thermodesulfobacteriota bacterium]|nr:MmgE/PrpD family protein [Thermodesulfobacteriota bacterium]
MKGYTRELARFAVRSRPGDVSGKIRHEGARALVNWIGLPIYFSRHDTAERAVSAFAEFSGPRQAGLLGRGERLDIFQAAFINCLASCIPDYDDTHLETVIHPTGVVASAIIALSEHREISGREFLHALILGVEAQCRLARALAMAPAKIDSAWFLTGITGGVGATIAAGRLLGLNEQQMVWAIGGAAARASGTRETHGTMAKNLVQAWTAQQGLQAAFLARQDFTTSDTILEGPRGIGRLYARDANFEVLVAGLGDDWELTRNAYKPFPSGIVMHGAVTGALEIARESHPDPAAIEGVDLEVHPLCLQLTGRRQPKTAQEATFSVFHWVAVALIDGRIGIGQFKDSCVADPQVIALRDRIQAGSSEKFARDEAVVRVKLSDGRVLERHVNHAMGSIERPLQDAELTAKLHDLADGVIGEKTAKALEERCWGVESLTDASDIAAAACGRE